MKLQSDYSTYSCMSKDGHVTKKRPRGQKHISPLRKEWYLYVFLVRWNNQKYQKRGGVGKIGKIPCATIVAPAIAVVRGGGVDTRSTLGLTLCISSNSSSLCITTILRC